MALLLTSVGKLRLKTLQLDCNSDARLANPWKSDESAAVLELLGGKPVITCISDDIVLKISERGKDAEFLEHGNSLKLATGSRVEILPPANTIHQAGGHLYLLSDLKNSGLAALSPAGALKTSAPTISLSGASPLLHGAGGAAARSNKRLLEVAEAHQTKRSRLGELPTAEDQAAGAHNSQLAPEGVGQQGEGAGGVARLPVKFAEAQVIDAEAEMAAESAPTTGAPTLEDAAGNGAQLEEEGGEAGGRMAMMSTETQVHLGCGDEHEDSEEEGELEQAYDEAVAQVAERELTEEEEAHAAAELEQAFFDVAAQMAAAGNAFPRGGSAVKLGVAVANSEVEVVSLLSDDEA